MATAVGLHTTPTFPAAKLATMWLRSFHSGSWISIGSLMLGLLLLFLARMSRLGPPDVHARG